MTEILQSPARLAPQQKLSLYRELLDCLEKEWQALVNSQEDAILALAAEKEQILTKISDVTPGGDFSEPVGESELNRLKHQVVDAQARNHRLIATALETIQDFLAYLQSAPPGIYHSAGKVEPPAGGSSFHRQV